MRKSRLVSDLPSDGLDSMSFWARAIKQARSTAKSEISSDYAGARL